jgi:tryptophan-rich sensory protein
VWTILYLLLGLVLFFLIRKKKVNGSWFVLTLFAVQLAVNYCWTPLYARGHLKAALYLILVMMLLTIMIMCQAKNATVSTLLAPYLVWLLFALMLNYESVSKPVLTTC